MYGRRRPPPPVYLYVSHRQQLYTFLPSSSPSFLPFCLFIFPSFLPSSLPTCSPAYIPTFYLAYLNLQTSSIHPAFVDLRCSLPAVQSLPTRPPPCSFYSEYNGLFTMPWSLTSVKKIMGTFRIEY